MFDPEKVKITVLRDSVRLLNISDAEYFGDGYKEYVSNSRLGLINPDQGGSPQKYFEGLGNNKIFSDSLVFGSAVHELVLQPESFELVETIDRPTAKAGAMADELYKPGVIPSDADIIAASNIVDYYKGKMDDKKIEDLHTKCDKYWKDRSLYEQEKHFREPIYLDPKSRERLTGCLHSIANNKHFQNLLHPTGLIEDPISENENVILLDVQVEIEGCEPFVIKLKSKLDNFTIDLENKVVTVNDLKTCGKMLNEFKTNSFNTYHYYREFAMYAFMLSRYVEHKYGLDKFDINGNALVISTIPQYYTMVYKVTSKDFMRGNKEFANLLKMVAYYTAFPDEI